MSGVQPPFLSVNGLTVEYTSDGKTIHAVNDVSFTLNRGETLGLVGETGAGKTTIAKSIIQVLPALSSRVVGGEIVLEGKNLFAMQPRDMLKIRGSKISMIFQDPMTALNPVMTVGKQIAEVVMLHNDVNKTEAADWAANALEMVGIPAARYKEYPHQFSGGMKQRVIIAMALACSPELLLADEPTTALDVTIQAQVLDMIYDLKEKNNTSMIMITHDLGVVAKVCDNVAIIYAGEIIEYGSKADIFDAPTHPYTIGLFGALPSMSEDESRLKPIEGTLPDPTDLPVGCKFSPRCPYVTDRCRAAAVGMVQMNGSHACRCILAGQQEVLHA